MRGRLGPQISVFAIQGMCNAVKIHVAHKQGHLSRAAALPGLALVRPMGKPGGAGVGPPGVQRRA